MGDIDYAALISKEPPEGLMQYAMTKPELNKEYLVYRAGSYYEPLEDRRKAAVEVTCTDCGGTFYAEKIEAGGCSRSWAPAPFGFRHPETGEEIISGNHMQCPFCGAETAACHIGNMRNWITEETWVTDISKLPVEGKTDRLLLREWNVYREIDKQGKSRYGRHLWTAWVVEERKIIRLMGYYRFYSTLTMQDLVQRKTFLDDYGEYCYLYKWNPAVMKGTTAENSKLDLYMKAGGKLLVAYLALWRRKPQVENLLMQDCGKLVAELIEKDQTHSSYERSKAIPKLEEINWKEKQPHKMLGLDKVTFREVKGRLNDYRLKLLRWAKESGFSVALPSGLELLEKYGLHLEEIYETVKTENMFWRTLRYLNRKNADWDILKDYWSMAKRLKMDLEDSLVQWPRNPRLAHDKAMERINERKDELLEGEFAARYKQLLPLAWEQDGILIRPCQTEKELRAEGKTLHHCVAGYAEDHATGKKAIFFIRRADRPDEPWYTLELNERTLTVRQNRGLWNCAKTKEVQDFESSWIAWVQKQAKRKEHAA